MSVSPPLLTIAIPTYNRCGYLAINLAQLRKEMAGVPAGMVEILVSDNASPDDTTRIVKEATDSGLPVRYVRNETNIGSDANIAQAYNLAAGKYVLILGDDDLLIDDALALLLQKLRERDYGVVTLRPYGYDVDFRREYPGGIGSERVFDNAGDFLVAINALMTLISACVINKSLTPGLDTNQFCGGNLVQAHLVLNAALAASHNLYLTHYLVAYKRNNSGGYDFFGILVTSLGAVIDQHRNAILTPQVIRRIENRLIVGYYPLYALKQRYYGFGDIESTRKHLAQRFGGRWLYRLTLEPIVNAPRPVAILWGGIVTAIGRTMTGDLRRGVAFIVAKIFNELGSKR